MTSSSDGSWAERVAELWTRFDEFEAGDFVSAIEALAAELPPGSAIAEFERASAFDSTGDPERAVVLYSAAIEAGLTGLPRRRAVIQMASSLRNLGEAVRSVALLRAEHGASSDELDDAVAAFLALALADTGHEREAAGIALGRLAPHLPRYQRSLARYAAELAGTE